MADCWNEGFESGLRAVQEAAQYGGLLLADRDSFEELLAEMPCASDTPRAFAAWKASSMPKLRAAAGEQAWKIVIDADDAYMRANA